MKRASHHRAALMAGVFLLSAAALQGHEREPGAGRPEIWTLWSFEPGVVAPLIICAVLYAFGLHRLPSRFRREAIWFSGGWLLTAVALVSPVHRWGAWLFSVHMTQHELLMIGAAPLLVLSRPGLVMLRAFAPATARGLTQLTERTGLTAFWGQMTRPGVAWLVHAMALWLWHIPSWFEATLHHEWIHAAQHASFLGTALWFWYSVFRGPRRAADYGWGVLNLFLTAVHSSVLGALITFAPRAWYPSYAVTAPEWGLSALQDQQLGGLVMWVPAGLVYILAALTMLAAWMRNAPAEDHSATRQTLAS